MAVEYELTLSDYISILKRRWVCVVVTFLVIFATATAIALLLPPVYESTGTILVEAQQIPTNLAETALNGYAEERIQIIKQRVMTRDNLYRIIKKYNLYDKKIETETISTLIDEMRDSINVELVDANIKGSSNNRSTTIAFKVSFDYVKADLAHKVANELVTLFLDENAKARTERATETTAFLTEEAARLKKELEAVENKVAAYKQEHAGSLPDETSTQMTMLERSQMDIGQLNRDYSDTQEQITFLQAELATASSMASDKVSSQNDNLSELDKTQTELDAALVTYTESHPTVKALRRKLAALKAAATAKPDAKKPTLVTDMATARLQAQINSARGRLASIAQQQSAIRARNNQLQNQVAQSPQVERGLVILTRDYDNAKKKYDELIASQQNAKINEKLEQENKAERFTMLEPPLFPDKPIKPNRQKVIVMGFFGAIAGALGLVIFLETLDSRVRGADALFAITKLRPLAVIPYISNKNEAVRKRKKVKYLLILLITFVTLSLVIVQIFVMPIDLAFIKIMARFS